MFNYFLFGAAIGVGYAVTTILIQEAITFIQVRYLTKRYRDAVAQYNKKASAVEVAYMADGQTGRKPS